MSSRARLTGVSRALSVTLFLVAGAATACGGDEPELTPLRGSAEGQSTFSEFSALHVETGQDHCNSDDIRSLSLLRDLDDRQGMAWFLRDAEGIMRSVYPRWAHVEEFSHVPAVPDSARDTGFRKDGLRFFVSADFQAAYVIRDGLVERWPASPPIPGCD